MSFNLMKLQCSCATKQSISLCKSENRQGKDNSLLQRFFEGCSEEQTKRMAIWSKRGAMQRLSLHLACICCCPHRLHRSAHL